MPLFRGRSVIYQRTTNSGGSTVAPADGYLLPNYHVTRWEGLPLTADSALDTDDGPTAITETIKEEDEEKQELTCKQKVIKVIKIMIPHVILISMLLSYLSIGAIILQRLETRTQVTIRTKQLLELKALYDSVTNSTWRSITAAQKDGQPAIGMSLEEWQHLMKKQLQKVSSAHEWVDFDLDTELGNYLNHTTKWTFPTALLYALTVLTTCGYGEVNMLTDGGKIFAVGFALVGIPLMFITAADIGKFLSETLLRFVAQGERFIKRALWCFCRRKSKHKASAEKVTVGLGDIVVENLIYLWMIVAYVIIGLSVVTMCVDLASTHLKAYFTRIHYYGQARSRFLGMSEDIREMVQLISAMRRKKGGKVTWNDVRQYMEAEQTSRLRAYIPRDIHKLRYVDETSSAMSTMRHNSYTSEQNVDSSQTDKLRRFSSLKAHHDPPLIPDYNRETQLNWKPPTFL